MEERKKKLSPVHPGKILRMNLSSLLINNVPASRIDEIVLGKRSITAEHGIKTGHIFNNSP